MNLLTDELRDQLLANGRRSREEVDFDPEPVVRLYLPDGVAVWLFSEIDPRYPDHIFGISDMGEGVLEMCYLSLDELHAIRGKLGYPVERDLHFIPKMTINEYAEEARRVGRIVA